MSLSLTGHVWRIVPVKMTVNTYFFNITIKMASSIKRDFPRVHSFLNAHLLLLWGLHSPTSLWTLCHLHKHSDWVLAWGAKLYMVKHGGVTHMQTYPGLQTWPFLLQVFLKTKKQSWEILKNTLCVCVYISSNSQEKIFFSCLKKIKK